LAGDKQTKAGDFLAKRVVSSLIGLPLLVLFMVTGGNYLKIAVGVVIIIAMSEVFHAFARKPSLVHYIGYLFAAIYMFFADRLSEPHILPIILIAFTISVLMALVFFSEKVGIKDCAVTIMVFCYIAVLMSTIYLLRESRYGHFFVWLSFIAAWGCDTGAYFTGVTIGKHKLVPKLSPKKTVEGSVGGVALATLLATVYGFVISTSFSSLEGVNVISFCATAGFVGSILSQFGDLTASAIKRYTGIKDYGKIIPGHGGIMDRFDSVLFTAPVIYAVMVLMDKL
jgi:phosphatidate cytidylyltransferase